MKKQTSLVLMSSIVLGSFIHQNYIFASEQAQSSTSKIRATKTTLTTITSTSSQASDFSTADIEINLTSEQPTLILSNLSSTDIQSITVTIASLSDNSDAYTYTATATTDGLYSVQLDSNKHPQADNTFTAKIAIERTNNITDFLSDFNFEWEITTPQDETPISETDTSKNTSTKQNATSGNLETAGTITVTKDDISGAFEVIVSNINTTEEIEEVLIPVWSANGGQDDITWYTARKQIDNTYNAIVSISDHNNDIGEYYIHVYYLDRKKQLAWVGGTSTDITKTATEASGHIEITNIDASAGTFDVVVSHIYAPNGLQEVKVPLWSEDNGQDDIKWYTAIKQTDGTYRVTISLADHKLNTGTYNAHLYYIDQKGQLKGIAATSKDIDISVVSGNISVTNQSSQTGHFDIVISNVSAIFNIEDILVPTWSEDGGQDDIQWYSANRQADGTYKISVTIANHKYSTGRYTSHVYYQTPQGNLVFLDGISFQVEAQLDKVSGHIDIEKTSYGFEVIISDVYAPEGVRSVSIPVWSETDGQDDIKWYSAIKQADGTYRASIDTADHKNNSGQYHAHLYYTLNNGKVIGVDATSTEITVSENPRLKTQYQGTGLYTVTLYNIQGTGIVNLAVWSDVNSQDDLRWYQATKIDTSTYRVNISVQNHSGTGIYHLHAYLHNNGQNTFLTNGHIEVTRALYEAPYFSQRDSRWGNQYFGNHNMDTAGYVPTVMAMAFSGLKGTTILPTDVAGYLYHNTQEFNKKEAGTTAAGIIYGANHYGINATAIHGKTAVITALQNGFYVTEAVGHSVFTTAPFTHEILLKGYKDGKTYVMDPYNAANNGWYSIDYLFSVPSDWNGDYYQGSNFIQLSE